MPKQSPKITRPELADAGISWQLVPNPSQQLGSASLNPGVSRQKLDLVLDYRFHESCHKWGFICRSGLHIYDLGL